MDRYAAEKIRSFGTSVFSEMSRLAVEHQAVNLGQGFPDFAGPDFVKEAAKRAIDADLNQYAVAMGPAATPGDRRRLGGAIRSRDLTPTREVTITTGATEASSMRFWRSSDPGDELVSFEPFYDSYPTECDDGRRHASVPITASPARLVVRSGRAAGRRHGHGRELLLLNTPHNPTGKVFTRARSSTSPHSARNTTSWR